MSAPYKNAAAALLFPRLEAQPDAPAYFSQDTVLTYRGLFENAARFGRLLESLGVGPGDRVALVLHDTPGAPAAFLGAMLLGACPVFLSTALRAEDYAFILNDSEAKALLVAEDHPAAAQAQSGVSVVSCQSLGSRDLESFSPDLKPCEPSPSAPAFMLYSSGSTGRPKGVPHGYRNLLIPAETLGRALDIREQDLFFSASKLSFAYGLIANLCLPLSCGAAGVLFPGKPGPYELFEHIARFRPTLFFGVPTLYNLMLRAHEPGQDLNSVRVFYSAGEALPAATFAAWKEATGREIVNGLGSTEAMNVYITNEPGRAVAGTTGRLIPGYQARLIDDAGQEAPPGAKGRLLLRGEGVCPAYWQRPEKTRETMLADGWLDTGDVFVVQDGVYTHQGRADDMMKVGAHWVSPLLIENTLLNHPAVAECAVAGCLVEGLEWPCAFVIPKAGTAPGPALAQELRGHVRELLPDYMCPVRVEFPAELPKTPTGKVQRFVLREQVRTRR